MSQMPKQLRSMFAFILAFCDMPNGVALFQEFEPYLCEDFRHHLNDPDSRNVALYHIKRIMESIGLRMADFGFETIEPDVSDDGEAAVVDAIGMTFCTSQ